MAEEARWSDAKVGVFVVAAVLILVSGSLWIAGSSIFGVKRVSYRVLMTDSGGVGAGDRVRIAGVPVGRVQSVRLSSQDDWPVTVDISLRSGVELHADGSATIATDGLLGASFLQIDPGSATAPLLPAGGEIHGTNGPDLAQTLEQVNRITTRVVAVLDKTGVMLEEISSHLGPTLEKVDRFLADDNAEDIRHTLASLRETVDEVAPRLGPLVERLESVAGDAETAAEQMPELVSGMTALTEDLQAVLGPDGMHLTRLLHTAESSLGSADQVLGVLGDSRMELGTMLEDLQQTVANLKSFSQQIEERPFSLVRIKPPRPREPGDGVGAGR